VDQGEQQNEEEEEEDKEEEASRLCPSAVTVCTSLQIVRDHGQGVPPKANLDERAHSDLRCHRLSRRAISMIEFNVQAPRRFSH